LHFSGSLAKLVTVGCGAQERQTELLEGKKNPVKKKKKKKRNG
jgi:hypothetical protein